MARDRDPAFPLYARDWLADRKVRRATHAQRAVLVDLWALAWEEGCLPDDLDELAYRCGTPTDPAPRQTVPDVLDEFFVRSVSDWPSLRLEREREGRAALRAKRAAAGRIGGSRPKHPRSTAEAQPEHRAEQDEDGSSAMRKPAAAAAAAAAASDGTTATEKSGVCPPGLRQGAPVRGTGPVGFGRRPA